MGDNSRLTRWACSPGSPINHWPGPRFERKPQLNSEFFPNNAVEYFVVTTTTTSPRRTSRRRDLFIEKDSDQRAHRADAPVGDQELFERRTASSSASVSCIYGIGDPVDYHSMILHLREGRRSAREDRGLRRDAVRPQRPTFARGTFRVRGDIIDVFPA